ncbi:UDP-N-acetylmuramoyl-tripeptide--D-alanyl-D-alanine ligase [Halothiobacillus sp. DCM-1]|uniref:UDP-N-acetylmuramoyl-tripeptide--D-alanyl-D- alanine ligase n=1 Tax=Halothiobacillus sp. DCM-1 TaxID=3112558 RepID=UPI003246F0A8
MLNTPFAQIASWLRCPMPDGVPADTRVMGVSTDTRSLAPGNLFFALKGARFDGHDHLAAAAERGAVAAVVSRPQPALALPQFVVPDTLQALQMLAQAWRQTCPATVVALTGSAGKTTVKQLLAAMLQAAGRTLATDGNLNNDIGVPLTLLRMDDAHRFAVIEMGANHVGEIAQLTALVQPKIGLVTMAGRAHMGEFGSAEAIVRAKGELFAGLAPDAAAIMNFDDAGLAYWQAHCDAVQAGFSLNGHPAARWQGRYDPAAHQLAIAEAGTPLFAALPIPLPGAHNALNLLAAVAVARTAGLSAAVIAEGLAGFVPPAGRMAERRLPQGLTLLDDSYNANPESMRAALQELARRPGRRVAVLGDMGELGVYSAAEHTALGAFAAALPLDALIALGDDMRATVAAFNAVRRGAAAVESVEAAVSAVQPWLADQSSPLTVLFKGSRFMRIERVLAALAPTAETGEGH